MAILKHIASKNADYGEAQRYLMFQYDEYTNKPILDENGGLIPRREYYIDGINCDPFTFDVECKELNLQYGKNQTFNEIKSHHYILSFDPKDAEENGLTGEQAQQLGLEYARKNFPGHQALVCTHTDGHNESGNIHVHIVINSLRKYDIEQQSYMTQRSEFRAGCKHHLTKDYLIHLKQSVMDICQRENLHQVDLLTPAEKKISDREYHAGCRGQKKMDERNQKMLSEGITPRQTIFQTQKEFLRTAIEDISASVCSLEEFQKLLLEKYHVTFKISRGRFSYLHPERNKPITGRNLGTHYEENYLLPLFEENAKHRESKNTPEQPSPEPSVFESLTDSAETKWPEISAFLFIKSDLRLVTDLQQCVKAQQSEAYARKVKLSNLQQMAKTLAYVQEHGYGTEDDLLAAFSEAQSQAGDMRKALRSTEQQLRKIREQIHYTGQYLANKSVYGEYLKSKNKKKFRQEHQSEITLYETARKILKEKSGGGKLPTLKVLKEKEAELSALKESQYTAYQNLHGYQNELKTVCANVDAILGKGHTRQHEPEKSHDIS